MSQQTYFRGVNIAKKLVKIYNKPTFCKNHSKKLEENCAEKAEICFEKNIAKEDGT